MMENTTLDTAVEALENTRVIEDESVSVVYNTRGPFGETVGEIMVQFITSGGWSEIGHDVADNLGENVEFHRFTPTGRGYFRVRP